MAADERKKFSHVSPDLIVEVMSPSDDFAYMQNKMELWIKNGVRLGWLVDTDNKSVYIYRKDGSVSIINSFNQTLSNEDVLTGFSFNLNQLTT